MQPSTPKRISLAVGLALTATGIGVVMAQSPAVVARTNGVSIRGSIAEVSSAYEACQSGEVLPSGTTAIRLSLEAMFGPTVRLRVLRDGVVLTRGTQAAGWSRQSVTVPVKALARTATGVSVCIAITPKDELVYLKGSPAAGAPSSQADGEIRIEYLRPGSQSWWTLASAVARRMSFGRATSGVWIVFAVVGAMLVLTAMVSWVAIRDPP